MNVIQKDLPENLLEAQEELFAIRELDLAQANSQPETFVRNDGTTFKIYSQKYVEVIP